MTIDSIIPLRVINIKSLRDLILDQKLSDEATLLLHSNNFDDIVLDHRDVYNQSLTVPYFLLDIYITEDSTARITLGKVGIIRNDSSRPSKPNKDDENGYFPEETVYKCGWCGDIVDFDGQFVSPQTRNYRIEQIKQHGNSIVQRVNGACCKFKNY